jgi:hypothetical protein
MVEHTHPEGFACSACTAELPRVRAALERLALSESAAVNRQVAADSEAQSNLQRAERAEGDAAAWKRTAFINAGIIDEERREVAREALEALRTEILALAQMLERHAEKTAGPLPANYATGDGDAAWEIARKLRALAAGKGKGEA